MRKTAFLLILIAAFYDNSSGASIPRDTAKRKYLGFDANPLLSQLIPLNRIGLDANVFAITRRNYWGQNGIRASYGVGLSENLDIQFLQVMVGYDHRRSISNRWLYFAGVDMIIRVLSEETFAGGGSTISSTPGFGWGGHWGVEYKLSRIVSLSTEANLQLMLFSSNGSASFILQPPMNISAHFNITH
jgi:hypothetical protein